MAECEKHFEQHHMFQCGECHLVLPCNHLLELHLQEEHDSFFAASVEHNQASYACLVESCGETFVSREIRQEHLQTRHEYPKWFRFHTLSKEEQRFFEKEDQVDSQSSQAFLASYRQG